MSMTPNQRTFEHAPVPRAPASFKNKFLRWLAVLGIGVGGGAIIAQPARDALLNPHNAPYHMPGLDHESADKQQSDFLTIDQLLGPDAHELSAIADPTQTQENNALAYAVESKGTGFTGILDSSPQGSVFYPTGSRVEHADGTVSEIEMKLDVVTNDKGQMVLKVSFENTTDPSDGSGFFSPDFVAYEVEYVGADGTTTVATSPEAQLQYNDVTKWAHDGEMSLLIPLRGVEGIDASNVVKPPDPAKRASALPTKVTVTMKTAEGAVTTFIAKQVVAQP